MQNDIVKPPKEAAERPAPEAQQQAGPALAGPEQQAVDSVVAQNPANQPLPDTLPQGQPEVPKDKSPEPKPPVKPHKSSGLAPVVFITVVICLVLIGVAVYTKIK